MLKMSLLASDHDELPLTRNNVHTLYVDHDQYNVAMPYSFGVNGCGKRAIEIHGLSIL